MRPVTFTDIAGLKLLLPHRLFLYIIGIFPNPDQNNFIKYATNVFGIFMFVLTATQCYLILFYLPHALKYQEFNKLALGINFVSVGISALQKHFLLKSKERVLHRLGGWAIQVTEKHKRENVPRHLALPVVKLTNTFYYFTVVFAGVLWIIWPFIYTGEPTGPSHLPKAYARHVMVVQVFIVTYVALIIAYTAVSVGYMQAILCSELHYVSLRMRDLKYDPDNPSDFKEKLGECVANHIECYRVSEDVKKIHSGMFAYQVFIAISVACGFIFGVLKKGILEKVITYILPVASATISDFALMCWLGEEISFEFKNIHWNIYNNNWYEAPPKLRRHLITVLETSKTPVYMVGAKVFRASLNTFVEAMKQAFSLFTLLKAMTGD